MWGIYYDLTKVAERGAAGGRLSLPQAKKQKAFMFTSQSWLDPGNRDVRRLDVQKLGGLVLYWSIVVYPLRLVLAAIFAMAGGPEKEFVSPVGTAREKELRWREFGEATEFVRLIVQQRDNWEMTFTSPVAFALSPHEILRMPGGWDHPWVGGDASGSEARMGDVVARAFPTGDTNSFSGPPTMAKMAARTRRSGYATMAQ